MFMFVIIVIFLTTVMCVNYDISKELEAEKAKTAKLEAELTYAMLVHAYEEPAIDELQSTFKEAAELYDIDVNLVYAIARHETGNFTSRLWRECNNAGGMKKSETEFRSYSTPEEGIYELTRMLKYNYIDKGLDTPEKMNQKYCPDDLEWAEKIERLITDGKEDIQW